MSTLLEEEIREEK